MRGKPLELQTKRKQDLKGRTKLWMLFQLQKIQKAAMGFHQFPSN